MAKRVSLPTLPPVRFVPSKETLEVLNGRQWICSYSGGKDSSSLVTWIEWLRRIGLVTCPTPPPARTSFSGTPPSV